VEADVLRPAIDAIEQAVKQVNDQLAASRKQQDQLQAFIRELQPIADVDLDISLMQKPRYIHAILGLMPTANLERLQASLSRVPHVLTRLSEDRQNAVVWLTGAQASADILDRAARSAYLNPLDLSEVHEGKPTEIIKSLQARIQNEEHAIAGLEAQLAALATRHRNELQSALWQVRSSRLLADAMSHYGKLRYTYLIVGWIPSANLPVLTRQLKQVSPNIIIEATASRRDGEGAAGAGVAAQPRPAGCFRAAGEQLCQASLR
jgi:vacuolar-type H+-ATPase subunit I/STV1